MRKCFVLIVLGCVCLPIFSQTKLSIELKYSSIAYETKELADGKIEKKTIDYGYSSIDLQLIDLVKYKLNEIGYIIVNGNEASYKILIHQLTILKDDSIDYSTTLEIYKSDQMIKRTIFKGREIPRDLTDNESKQIVLYLKENIK